MLVVTTIVVVHHDLTIVTCGEVVLMWLLLFLFWSNSGFCESFKTLPPTVQPTACFSTVPNVMQRSQTYVQPPTYKKDTCLNVERRIFSKMTQTMTEKSDHVVRRKI